MLDFSSQPIRGFLRLHFSQPQGCLPAQGCLQTQDDPGVPACCLVVRTGSGSRKWPWTILELLLALVSMWQGSKAPCNLEWLSVFLKLRCTLSLCTTSNSYALYNMPSFTSRSLEDLLPFLAFLEPKLFLFSFINPSSDMRVKCQNPHGLQQGHSLIPSLIPLFPSSLHYLHQSQWNYGPYPCTHAIHAYTQPSEVL